MPWDRKATQRSGLKGRERSLGDRSRPDPSRFSRPFRPQDCGGLVNPRASASGLRCPGLDSRDPLGRKDHRPVFSWRQVLPLSTDFQSPEPAPPPRKPLDVAPALVSRGIDHIRIGGIEFEIGDAGVLVDLEHRGPGGAAIGGAVDASLPARGPERPTALLPEWAGGGKVGRPTRTKSDEHGRAPTGLVGWHQLRYSAPTPSGTSTSVVVVLVLGRESTPVLQDI